ncbi:MAG: DivIVA domain-containing protein [Bacteroidetes bacterium]|jgi:cell division initiation protein|nr:DivIVA domain-containing protein [Bacteroidota bacterium]
MKITPLEIKRQQFKKVMRGFDPVEVETFLDMLSNELEEHVRTTKDLRDRILELETQLADYKQMEKTLQQTLMQAQEASGKSIENSRKEADLIIRDAELKAQQIIDKARMDFSKIKEEISTLKARKESVLSRLKILLSSELDLIRALGVDDEDRTSGDGSKGSGKDKLELDSILKNL